MAFKETNLSNVNNEKSAKNKPILFLILFTHCNYLHFYFENIYKYKIPRQYL